MNNTVIFINGAKRAGKDSVASMIHKTTPYRVLQEKAAKPLYESLQRLFSLSPSQWADMYENAKEEPSEHLMGMSPRQAMIWLSEIVMKPRFGADFFGVSLGQRIEKASVYGGSTVSLVSDAGFVDEIKACMDYLYLGEGYRFHLIRVIREGTSYDGDSREYLDPNALGLHPEQFDVIINDGGLFDLEKKVGSVLSTIGVGGLI